MNCCFREVPKNLPILTFLRLKMEFPVSIALLNNLLKCACDLTVPFVTPVVVVAFVVAQSSPAASMLSSESFD